MKSTGRAAGGEVPIGTTTGGAALPIIGGEMQQTRSQSLPRALTAVAALTGLAYLVWRGGWTLSGSALWLAVPLYAAELHGFLTFLLYAFMTWDVTPLPWRRARPDLSVDLLIPTYDEGLEVLAPTVAAARAVRYPHETYVLDDGRRPWVEELCRQLDARYITRPDSRGAKAGNLNDAIARTQGEFLAVVDADFVPAPDFLDAMLGYFDDPQVAFVQGPQEFYNLDSFQHVPNDSEGWHEQAIFFRIIQRGKNHWNAAFWCGSPSILRRAALESVGGIAEETVTEDLHTSVRLHRAGWKSVFHPGIVARGLAPDDFHAFILQRVRWAQGAMQVIRREGVYRGLKLAQRLNYIASTGTYFDSYRKAALLAILPAVLVIDRLPIAASVWTFLPFWLTQFLLMGLATSALGRGSYRMLPVEFFDLAKTFAFLHSSLTVVFNRRLIFRVTPKAGSSRSLNPFLAPFLALIGIYAVSLLVGLLRLSDIGLHTDNGAALAVAMAWCALLLAFIAGLASYGYYHENKRRAYRHPVTTPAALSLEGEETTMAVQLRDVSMSGCAFVWDYPLHPATRVRLQVPRHELALKGTVRGVIPVDGGYRIGMAFDEPGGQTAALAALVAGLVNQEPARQPAGGETAGRPAAA